MKKMLVDPKCTELAEHFLTDSEHKTPGCRDALAEYIQEAVEYFMLGVDECEQMEEE